MNKISQYEKIPEIEKDFPIKIGCGNQKRLTPHWHEHLEIIHILSGSCHFACDTEEFDAEKGDTVVVNSNELHTFHAPEPLSYFFLIINPVFFSDVNFNNVLLDTHIKGNKFISNCFEEIYEKYNSSDYGSDMLVKSSVYRLMAYLAKNHTTHRLSSREYDIRTTKLERINTTLDYISKHYHEKLSTMELSKMCFLSESYFCRFFKDATGKSVLNYINELRINKASVLLKNTDESITSIAMNVGYDDINYFDRCFKKKFGVNPSTYRTQN